MSKQSETRVRILDRGLKLLSVQGVSGISFGQLAEHAGMSKSGLFAHFKSKEEVQVELLDRAAVLSHAHVVAPAVEAAEGRPRLEALVANWMGWTARAGLPGGCPVAAAIFELDDAEGPVRDHALALEREWRRILGAHVEQAIACGHFRRDLDTAQFVWELCGIYLSHHASLRFVRDPKADRRAEVAVQALMTRGAQIGSPTKTNRRERK